MVHAQGAGRYRPAFFYAPVAGVFAAIERYNADADAESRDETSQLEEVVGRDPVAEALIAQSERAVAVEAKAEAEGQNAPVAHGLDILDVLDAMASHYGETTREMLKFWSWKLFCARWRRLVEYMEVEREKRRDREREEAFRRLQAQTAREHREPAAGVWLMMW